MIIIAIQALRIIWTKASRGGQGATRRAALPTGYPFPSPGASAHISAPAYILQHIRRDERSDFRPHTERQAADPLRDTLIVGQLAIHPPDGAGIVRVTYQPRRPTYLSYARDHTGAYRPGGEEALALQLGEWGRVRYNWRHADWEDTWYDQWDVNIGCFAALQPDAFLATPPIKVYSRLSPLR